MARGTSRIGTGEQGTLRAFFDTYSRKHKIAVINWRHNLAVTAIIMVPVTVKMKIKGGGRRGDTAWSVFRRSWSSLLWPVEGLRVRSRL
jgi:hypothetical protein